MSFWEGVATIGGKVADTLLGVDQSKRQEYAQREFAKHGIRWKVADAKAAGLHPLAALGAAGAAYSPVAAAGSDLGSIGQDISRSIDATRTAEERRTNDAATAAAQRARDESQRAVDQSIINRNNAAAALDQAQAAEIGNRRAQNPPMAAERPGDGVANHPAFGPHKRVPPQIPESRPGQPGVLGGPALPLTRMGAFTVEGSTYHLEMPNMDPGEFWENPIAAMAALRALNPHVAPQVIEKLFQREFRPIGSWGRESRQSSPRPPARRSGRGLGWNPPRR